MAEANVTKAALMRSLKQLMSKKSFARINITDICEVCGINRKSFYYHFKDKYDLMNWIFYSDFVKLNGVQSFKSGWDLLKGVCELFYADQDFYRSALKTEGQNSFKEYLLESMIPIVDFLFEDIWGDLEYREIAVRIFCEAYIMAVSYWLNSNNKAEPEKFVNSMMEIITKLADFSF